jgi:hypothetical protein
MGPGEHLGPHRKRQAHVQGAKEQELSIQSKDLSARSAVQRARISQQMRFLGPALPALWEKRVPFRLGSTGTKGW